MGELDEKEVSPPEPQPETEEPTETDKMLKKDENNTETDKFNTKSSENLSKKSSPSLKTPNEDKSLAEGEEIVEIIENEVVDEPVKQDGREVKPKKIPIGGIKMPGFFTKNKPRNEEDGADGELLEKGKNEKKMEEDKPKEEIKGPTIGQRIRNFFTRKPKTENEPKDVKDDEKTETIEAPPPKKGLLNAIKLPIANIIPRRKVEGNEDLELGKTGPGTKAGLASMETLDDSLKDQDNVDKAKINEDNLETIKLTDEKKDDEPKKSILSRATAIGSYKCSVDDAAIAGGILLFILLVTLICVFAFSGKEALKSPPIREGRFIEAVTSCGMIEGIKDDNAFTFFGIPYAIPPINENRWKYAKPIESIEYCWNGTLPVHNPKEPCIQVLSNGTTVGKEDCLTLDIVTPYVRYENPMPVIVLIGAESFMGGSPGILKPSSKLAQLKDVIFVRPNFRMGPFGYLALDSLAKSTHPPSTGNYALSDIIAALKWIKLNIVHFGGDINSITLFGHRTGATLVSVLSTSPQAKNLFTRAWASSSSAIFPGKPLTESIKLNNDFLDLIQCNDAECLRNSTVDEILNAVPDTWHYYSPDLPNNDENTIERHEWLVLDGQILQEHLTDVLKRETNLPTLIFGTTKHESHSDNLYIKYTEWTPEIIKKHIDNSKIGVLNLTDDAINFYSNTYQGLTSMITDIRTICPLLIIARPLPTIMFYVVTHKNTDLNISNVDIDVQAILGDYSVETTEDENYVNTIQELFYQFVINGDTKQFETRRKVIEIDQDIQSQDNNSNCDFWIGKDITPRYSKIE